MARDGNKGVVGTQHMGSALLDYGPRVRNSPDVAASCEISACKVVGLRSGTGTLGLQTETPLLQDSSDLNDAGDGHKHEHVFSGGSSAPSGRGNWNLASATDADQAYFPRVDGNAGFVRCAFLTCSAGILLFFPLFAGCQAIVRAQQSLARAPLP
jgi:hypothetical protein